MISIWIYIIVFLAFPACLLTLRMLAWWKEQHPKVLLAQDIKASDLISLFSLALTIASLVIGWYTISGQITKGSLDIQIKNVSDQNAVVQQQLISLQQSQAQAAIDDTDIHLESPIGNERVLGSHFPELRWKYAKHNSATDYLVEVSRVGFLSERTLKGFRIADQEECRWGDTTCRVHASAPMGQSTSIKLKSIDASHEGRYLWRVTPVGMGSDSRDGATERWSEYGSFCIYRKAPIDRACLDLSQTEEQKRDRTRDVVVVGTNNSENVEFSGIAKGRRTGFDVELIRLVVEGCLSYKESFVFDSDRCLRNVAEGGHVTGASAGLNDRESVLSSGHRLRVVFRSFDSVDDGLAALSRGGVDLFIGAMTKTADREKFPVRLTAGYFPVSSVLFSRKEGETGMDLAAWEKRKTTLGVIDRSTNQRLAEKLISVDGLDSEVALESFSSFGSLKESLEQGRISSVLVDSTLEGQLKDVVRIEIPCRIRGAYLKDLGQKSESFAIAVASNTEESSLYQSIEDALGFQAVKDAETKMAKRIFGATGYTEQECSWIYRL